VDGENTFVRFCFLGNNFLVRLYLNLLIWSPRTILARSGRRCLRFLIAGIRLDTVIASSTIQDCGLAGLTVDSI